MGGLALTTSLAPKGQPASTVRWRMSDLQIFPAQALSFAAEAPGIVQQRQFIPVCIPDPQKSREVTNNIVVLGYGVVRYAATHDR